MEGKSDFRVAICGPLQFRCVGDGDVDRNSTTIGLLNTSVKLLVNPVTVGLILEKNESSDMVFYFSPVLLLLCLIHLFFDLTGIFSKHEISPQRSGKISYVVIF